MNPEVKTLWLNALRSGKYKQGSNVLRDKDDNYCCLGVLTDLYIKETLDVDGWTLTDKGRYEFNDNIIYLSKKVVDWAGIVSVNPINPIVYDENGKPQSLALLNDCGMSFEEIAAIIEAQL